MNKTLLWLLAWFVLVMPGNAFAFKAILLLEHNEATPWHELLKAGLQRAGHDFDIETETRIAPRGSDQVAIFRQAAEDADLVLVASDSLHEILRDNAGNFRRVMFGSVDAGIRASNIMSVTFADEQAAFLAGVAAAIATGADNLPGINAGQTIGWLSGADTPALRSLVNGFSEGAKLIRNDIKISQGVSGSFESSSAAAEKARNILDAGADVIALASGSGNGAAREELEKSGAWRIDLDSLQPGDRRLGAIVKAADRAVYEIVSSAANGKFRAKEIVVYNLANGGVDWIGMDEMLALKGAPADLKRRVAELRGELEKGAIHLKSLRARTLCDCLD